MKKELDQARDFLWIGVRSCLAIGLNTSNSADSAETGSEKRQNDRANHRMKPDDRNQLVCIQHGTLTVSGI
ncbi:MAG: hypothetical protein HKP52_07400 [Desulfofustis sp.]|nr:hypothetical protein [Desulfofustis sp.]